MEVVYKWLEDIQKRHLPFDITTWVPPSIRWRHLSVKVLWRTDFEDLYQLPTTDELTPSVVDGGVVRK